MDTTVENSTDTVRLRVSRTLLARLSAAFPAKTYSQAVEVLLDTYERAHGDPVAGAQTELWIKLNRLEEAAHLLSLTNLDIADLYRRMVAGEIAFMRSSSVHLAEAANQQTTQPSKNK